MTSTRKWLGRLQSAEGPLFIGAVTAAISSRVGPSWDEAYWLAIGRMVESGRVLYEGAIDNKSPLVHLLVWMLDRLPGPYSLARGIFLGSVIGVTLHLGLGLTPLSTREGRIVLSAVVGVWILLMTDLVVTTEVCAALALTAALAAARKDRPWSALALAIGAPGFDIRAVLLLPAVAVAVSPPYRRRFALGLTVAIGLTAVIVLSVPHLFYALIELSLASRGEKVVYPAAGMVRSFSEAVIPLLALWLVFHYRRIGGWHVWVFAAAVVLGAVSGRPYSHYWVYLAVAQFGIVGDPRSMSHVMRATSAMAFVLLLVPAFDTTRIWLAWQHSVNSRVAVVFEALSPTEKVLIFDSVPFLSPLVADRLVMRAPSAEYLAWPTSRTEQFRSEIPTMVAQADVVIDQDLLFAPAESLQYRYRELQSRFAAETEDFVCVQTVEGFTLRRRGPCNIP